MRTKKYLEERIDELDELAAAQFREVNRQGRMLTGLLQAWSSSRGGSTGATFSERDRPDPVTPW